MISLLATLLIQPASAQGPTYECDSVHGDRVWVKIEYSSDVQGKIEVESRGSEFPIPLVVQPFDAAPTADGKHIKITSKEDGQWKYQAHVILPAEIAEDEEFEAILKITRSSTPRPMASTLTCK